jgi:hypothetical protein
MCSYKDVDTSDREGERQSCGHRDRCRRARTRHGCFLATTRQGSAGMAGMEGSDEYETHLFDDCGGGCGPAAGPPL